VKNKAIEKSTAILRCKKLSLQFLKSVFLLKQKVEYSTFFLWQKGKLQRKNIFSFLLEQKKRNKENAGFFDSPRTPTNDLLWKSKQKKRMDYWETRERSALHLRCGANLKRIKFIKHPHKRLTLEK